MKKIRILLILFITITCLMPVGETKAQEVNVSFSVFHQQLSPYGKWLHNPRFGEVWVYNNAGFKPYYSDGHWEYTNYGWSWVSDHDWGWAPFHYGRWEYDPHYGWMWIPGYEWASAWVSWSSYGDYYGWAPLGHGVNINVSFGSIPYDRWTFIPRRNICDRDIKRYYVSPQRNYGFRNAVVINNYYTGNGRERYMRGPERREVERYTHNRVQERRIDDRERQGYHVNRPNNNGDQASNSNDRNQSRQRDNDVFTRNNNNNQGNEDRRPNRESNNLPQGNENTNQPRQRDNDVFHGNNNRRDEERKPNREANNVPQRNENRFPDRKPNDNQVNRDNGQQNNFPGRQQQQRQIERPAPEQRRMERPNGHDNGGGFQRPAKENNSQRQNSNFERRKKDK